MEKPPGACALSEAVFTINYQSFLENNGDP